ncbi:LysE family transporter [Agromyces sp. NPDC049794]|uniref:LysE family translocator n=1 Tax=unclassified Agromyces TaxID=2639701 RepID=UPI0033C0BB1F
MTLALLALTALPFVVSPGASFAITVDAVSAGDRRAPAKVWAGTTLGITVVVVIAALSGIGQLLATHQTAREIFGIVGGAILILLGILSGAQTLRSMRRSVTDSRPARRLILWAFFALVTNIKALGLYTLVVPNLRLEGLGDVSLLFAFAVVHAVMLLAWLSLLGHVVRRTPRFGTSPRVRVGLTGLTALTLIAIGIRTSLESLH